MVHHHKLLLEEDDALETFFLVALHCSEDPYKMAFIINKQTQISLKRNEKDIHLSYPVFSYEDSLTYTQYHLIANKCQVKITKKEAKEDLFSDVESEKYITKHLVSKYQTVDYFLKISTEEVGKTLKTLLLNINNIPQIISAYPINTKDLYTINNLIFD